VHRPHRYAFGRGIVKIKSAGPEGSMNVVVW
jgi:hypothetical protein